MVSNLCWYAARRGCASATRLAISSVSGVPLGMDVFTMAAPGGAKMQQQLRLVKDISDISICPIYLLQVDVCALLLPMFFCTFRLRECLTY